MIEWFQSIGQWFVENKDGLVTFVTSSNFVGFIANFVLIIKTMIGLKTNNKVGTDLKLALEENSTLKKELADVKAEQAALKAQVEDLKQMLVANNEAQQVMLTKLNATLDVQSIVYSTLKSSESRTTVQNIIANAKFAENNNRLKLIEELEDLRKKVVDTQQAMVQTVEQSVEKVEAIADNKVNVSRY